MRYLAYAWYIRSRTYISSFDENADHFRCVPIVNQIDMSHRVRALVDIRGNVP